MPVLFGDDFSHQDAKFTYEVCDYIMKWLQLNSLEWYGMQFDFKYSTVDDYLNEIHKEGYTFPLYKGDFLPLIDESGP